jgi:hypothetical protein
MFGGLGGERQGARKKKGGRDESRPYKGKNRKRKKNGKKKKEGTMYRAPTDDLPRLGTWEFFVFQEIPGVFVDLVGKGVVIVVVVAEFYEVNLEIFFPQQVSRFAGFSV